METVVKFAQGLIRVNLRKGAPVSHIFFLRFSCTMRIITCVGLCMCIVKSLPVSLLTRDEV